MALPFTLGDYLFSVDDMQITPLACTIHLTCKEDEAYIDEQTMDIVSVQLFEKEFFIKDLQGA